MTTTNRDPQTRTLLFWGKRMNNSVAPKIVSEATHWNSSFHFFHPQVGVEVAHPGVENDFNDESAKKYYTYYQWVCFVLFFQVSSEGNSRPANNIRYPIGIFCI